MRYNRFHVTALCSPTRAALLTGRNSHAVGFGSIGEFSTGFAGYTAFVPDDCVPFPRILRDNGYSTAAFGKWHLTPDGQQGPAGPVRPLARRLGVRLLLRLPRRGLGPVGPLPGREPEDHRHARGLLRRGETPTTCPTTWRTRRSSGCTRSGRRTRRSRSSPTSRPAAATLRTTSSERVGGEVQGQVRPGLGQAARGDVRPAEGARRDPRRRGADARATRRSPPGTTSRTSSRRIYARQMEVYAGYSENADHNVGRVIDAIDELGELDNTLVLWIWGDNGASMEGTITGSFNELTMQNGIPLTDEMQLQLSERYGGIEAWGNQMMAPHYSAAWAWAGNTPFKWGKQVGSHLGGTRNPLVVHWPERITETRRPEDALHPRDRHRPDDPRHRRHPDADAHRRDRAAADARRDVRRLADRRRRPRAPHPAVLRDDRQPGDVQGRLVAVDEDRADPVGAHARGARSPTRPACGTPTRIPSSSTTCPTTSPRPGTSPRSIPRRCKELKELFWQEAEKYNVLPLMAPLAGVLRHACRRCRRSPSYEFRGDVQNVLLGDDPADLQPLLHDQRRPRDPAGRRRRGDRRRGRPPGRVLAVRRRRQADAHLLDDGRVRLPPAGRGAAARGRGDGAHGVRRRRGRSRPPAAR